MPQNEREMVKAVIGEESQLKLAEDRLSQSSLPSEVTIILCIFTFSSHNRFYFHSFAFYFFHSQVGLAIGKLSSSLDRGFVFDLIPTPPNDSNQPASSVIDTSKDDKRKGAKSKSQASDSSSLFIDVDWVAEHARQVR